MTAKGSNDVFISYRREVGGVLALALHQHLTERQVDVFYDIESLRAGQFDTIILNQIAARPYFVLVLTPGTLDRCHEPKDWLRREIEQALSTQRVIVPVHTPNFDFGDMERLLPEHLASDLQRFNGQELPQRWFKYAVGELVDEFLVPIEIESVAPPVEDRAVVDRLRVEVQAATAVTETQLTAQEYFERAYARSDDDLERRIADYSEAIRLDPEYAAAFNNRGNARRDQGDLEGSLADYDEAIRLEPDYAYAFNNRGIARRDRGDLEGSLADYDEAIRLDPEYAVALYNRALTRHDLGQVAEAIADVELGAVYAPDDEDFPNLLAKLRAQA